MNDEKQRDITLKDIMSRLERNIAGALVDIDHLCRQDLTINAHEIFWLTKGISELERHISIMKERMRCNL